MATPGSKPVPISCIPGLGVANLSAYVGKSVEDFCPLGYGKKKDNQNHCAHFVSHALNIQVGKLCSDLLPYRAKPLTASLIRSGVRDNELAGLFTLDGKHRNPFKGGSTRVNDIYNSIGKDSKGDWDSRSDPNADCLIYVTIPENISKDRAIMNEMSRKHVGIHYNGKIYHYGNTGDQVASDTIEQFKTKFKGSYGKDAVFLWSSIPHVADACVHRGALSGD